MNETANRVWKKMQNWRWWVALPAILFIFLPIGIVLLTFRLAAHGIRMTGAVFLKMVDKVDPAMCKVFEPIEDFIDKGREKEDD